jgi:hypothetical protein
MPAPTLIRRVDPKTLTPAGLDALWEFHSRFVVRSRASFERGIRSSDELWLLELRTGGIVGFATVSFATHVVEGRERMAIYTQWAFVDPAHRRRGFIQRVGLSAWLRCRLRKPSRPVYWVFTASSLDSYMHMLRTAGVAYPNRHERTPPLLGEILDRTLRAVGTGGWDREGGVVRRSGEVRYLTGLARDDDTDPDAAFYRASNPGQEQGDSLGCIAAADFANLAVYVRRLTRRREARSGA